MYIRDNFFNVGITKDGYRKVNQMLSIISFKEVRSLALKMIKYGI